MKSLVDIVADTAEYLEDAKKDSETTKEDVCQGIRNRLSIIMSKLVSYPVCTNFALPLPRAETQPASDNDSMREFFSVPD